MEKIVILSLGKSGTTSASDFFEKMNYKTIHYLGDIIYSSTVRPNTSQETILKKYSFLEKDCDVFSDYPYCMAYEYFDKKYKNTKFILITRDSKDWAKSVQSSEDYWHSLSLAGWKKYLNVKKINFSNEELENLYNTYTKDVLKYFKHSKNFIHLNLYDKKINKKILKFLNISSNIDFPKSNITVFD
jgi:hypothetical protein